MMIVTAIGIIISLTGMVIAVATGDIPVLIFFEGIGIINTLLFISEKENE